MPITSRVIAAHQLHVRLLVSGFEVDDLLPPSGEPQQVQVPQAKRFPAHLGPFLVAVLWAQLTAVEVERAASQLDIAGGDRPAGQLVELHGVDGDLGVGEQLDGVVAQHDGVGLPGRSSGVVGGLVQFGSSNVKRLARPHHVDDLLAMQTSTGCQGQDLDQCRGVTSRPVAARDGSPSIITSNRPSRAISTPRGPSLPPPARPRHESAPSTKRPSDRHHIAFEMTSTVT